MDGGEPPCEICDMPAGTRHLATIHAQRIVERKDKKVDKWKPKGSGEWQYTREDAMEAQARFIVAILVLGAVGLFAGSVWALIVLWDTLLK